MGDRVFGVGPVLISGEVAEAITEAIRDENEAVLVVDRGAYLRLLVPHRCRVSRSAIENRLGRPFWLPADLEAVMPSFDGKLKITPDEVEWR
ncbi:MAG: MmoB/DmpM family protein [Deltaproteobacteria bacterium]|nr:MmoB/DmpM family protein [Deltaproteobacteria bacterium]